jgi:hypothetical protein
MAKDVEIASLFQPFQCRATDLLGAHLGQVAGAAIEAKIIAKLKDGLAQDGL